MSHKFYKYQSWRVIEKCESLSDGGKATPLHVLNLASSTTVA